MDNPIVENSLDKLVDEISGMVAEEQVTTLNVLSICIHLMQIVERYPNLSGPEKKDLVIRVLTKVITDKGGDMAIMALVPSFIDSAISIEKDKIHISIDRKGATSCCVGMLSCLAMHEAKK